MIVTAIEVCESGNVSLYEAFPSSAAYLDAIYARPSEKAKQQSIAGLQALLLLLRQEGVDTAGLVLKRQPGGKPYFEDSDWQFGISHSGGLAVCGLDKNAVGIDIEQVKDKKNIQTLAKRFFSSKECDIISLAQDKTNAFFTIWTKKEASLKRYGGGVDCLLIKIDTEKEEYTVFDVSAGGSGYVVTVAGADTVKVIGGTQWTRRR